MSAGRICTRVVATASADENVAAAARRMKEHNVGSLVVVGEGSRPEGMLTDRDIVVRCIAEGLAAADTTVGDVMTSTVRSVDESTPIEDALSTMRSVGARRVVVTGSGGELVGLLAIDDVIRLLAEELAKIDGIVGTEAPVI